MWRKDPPPSVPVTARASLTESDRLARWYATWTGDARVGGTVTLSFVAEEVGPGWEYYLDRLAAALAGEAMPDWDDYWPGLAAAYA